MDWRLYHLHAQAISHHQELVRKETVPRGLPDCTLDNCTRQCYSCSHARMNKQTEYGFTEDSEM